MTEAIVVEWGNWSGNGFVEHRGSAFGPPPDAHVAAVRGLIDDLLEQPPFDWDSRSGGSSCGLIRVAVDGGGKQWCFVVQGRAAPFPKGGGCQFVFFDEYIDAPAAWARGIASLDATGQITPRSLAGPSAARTGSPDLVQPVLAAVLSGQPLIDLGDTEEAANTVGAALALMPETAVRRYHWFTRILDRPHSDVPVVSGRWPHALAGTRTGRRVNTWLSAASPIGGSGFSRQDEVIRWLAAQAREPAIVAPYRDCAELGDFVATLVRKELPIRLADVPSRLDQRDEELVGPRGLAVLGQFVHATPREAIRYALLPGMPAAISAVIVDVLIDMHDAATDGSNPAMFPPTPEPHRGWHLRLAGELLHRYPGRVERVAAVKAQLFAPGRPLAREVDRAVVPDEWWRALELSITDFEVPVDRIVDRIRVGRTVEADIAAALNNGPDPLLQFQAVVDKVGQFAPITVREAVGILRLVADPETQIARKRSEREQDRDDPRTEEPSADDECQVARKILARNRMHGWSLSVDWAETLIAARDSHQVVLAVWEAFTSDKVERLPDDLLIRVLEMAHGETTDFRHLLAVSRVALEHHRDAARQPRPAPAPVIPEPSWHRPPVTVSAGAHRRRHDEDPDRSRTVDAVLTVFWPLVYMVMGALLTLIVFSFDRIG